MGKELGQFFRDQERTHERLGVYASAVRFHANRLSGYLANRPEVTGTIGLGFPFYLPKQVPSTIQIEEQNRFVAEKKAEIPVEKLQDWECPQCFSEGNLSGTRNHVCQSCIREHLKPSTIQKMYTDLDILCLIDADPDTFQQTSQELTQQMHTSLFPSFDFGIGETLSQYTAFTEDPLAIPPPLDLHFARTEDFIAGVKAIRPDNTPQLPVISAYDTLRAEALPFGVGSLYLTEPILLAKDVRRELSQKRGEFVGDARQAKQVLAQIKQGSGQIRRMFAQPDLETGLIEKMVQGDVLPETAIAVFGTRMPGASDVSLAQTEGQWRVETAVTLAAETGSAIVFSGFESDEMAEIAVHMDPSIAPSTFIEPYSASTEENIRALPFFEERLLQTTPIWIAVSNEWHLQRIRWLGLAENNGFRFTPYAIETYMRRTGVDEEQIRQFQQQRYLDEAAKIKQMTGYLPSLG